MSDMLLTAYNGAILGPIAKLLGWIMNGIYYLMLKMGLNSIGLSIIFFTIIIYALMFPITYKQQKFSKLSQKMQPEINAINKKYQGKRDQASAMAMREETQAVYDKYGVSMTGGCGWMLIQFPILLALYRVFLNVPAYVTEVKNNFTPLVEGIMASAGYQDKMADLVKDLSIYTTPAADFTVTDQSALSNYIIDVLYKLSSSGWETLKGTFPALSDSIVSVQQNVSEATTFLCYNISDTPWEIIKTSFSANLWLMVLAAVLIPVCSYLTQVWNMKLMPQADPAASGNPNSENMSRQMKMMNKVMPLTSLVICFTVPVGLGIYWIVSALVRVVQQYILNRYFEKVDLEDIIRKNREKAKKKREKMGITEKQITNAARINTRQIAEPSKKTDSGISKEQEARIEKASEMKAKAKSGSMAEKANRVRQFNEKNNRK